MAAISRVRLLPLSFALFGVLFLAAACGDGDVPAGRTGIEIVDTVLEAMETSNPEDLVSLVRLEEHPCIRGGPTEVTPVCAEDQETGTLVKTFTSNVCVGLQRGAASQQDIAEWIVDQELKLYGVYELPPDNSTDTEYTLLFNQTNSTDSSETEMGLGLRLSNQQILGSLSHCGQPASKFSESFDLGQPILLGK